VDRQATERRTFVLSRLTSSGARFLKDEGGPTAVGYARLRALIVVACASAVTALGSNPSNTFAYVGPPVGNTNS
jgi:Flp pilus assembly pilin Flp